MVAERNNELDKLEEELDLIFPSVYKAFYSKCQKAAPKELVGVDLYNDKPELKEWAVALLEEDKVENFLTEKDFVFMMHQGYIFWYFRADGNENPIVYGYHESELEPKKIGYLKDFLNN